MKLRTSRRGALKLASLAMTGVLLSGCGLSSGSSVPLAVEPGSIQPVPELEGVTITVGSKNFTEQVVLGYIAQFALSAGGAEVRDLSSIVGSSTARNALQSGQIDILWDYTGTSWISYNGNNDPIPDARAQYEAVAKQDLERNGVAWTAIDYNVDNTYAFAVNQDAARRLGVEKLSDIPRVVAEHPDLATFCVDTEFANRNDGFPGVQQEYGFTADKSKVKTLTEGSIYQATANGTCTFGEVFTTDGRIKALDLKVLDDDKLFFPRYNIGVTTRDELLERYPQITAIFEPVSAALTNEELVRLNAQVDVDGRDPADVARDWMAEKGFVTIPGR
ncbi:osmoprotectant transport system substrate-binding protein [Saccharopolyspora antimicrobica]|uniref:Osmoprotectant transport system substrate-binding protein n=1 Tax=Saccharopolyspora antimicrobica TaxID=455193 RepID=A0A1I4X5P0_9PSEU|nr:glycine betaine ABC transporter substrate-binding protein [Saccharopolyspora antimicrobica]RKT84331.1 osmoprotectant transport system substrate-binding protein [Saccharopolyspora antimicrobica]SFN21197.1 osmoprotectant transport system substrate-binding protein [Saccharopolyspora antimicrobica]